MGRNLFDTLAEAIEDIEDRDGEHDVVLLPPANEPYNSDEEVEDDDTGFGGNLDLLDLPANVTGAVEIHGTESGDSETDDEIDEEPKRTKVRTLALRHIILLQKH